MSQNQTPKRQAEFIVPPNEIKNKVGEGGLPEEILDKAEQVIEESSENFIPMANGLLEDIAKGIARAKAAQTEDDRKKAIQALLYSATQLKANGTMFHYPIITQMADKLIQFLKIVDEMDAEAAEVANAFHRSLHTVITGKITGEGGDRGQEVVQALDGACSRYFQKKK